MIKTIEQAKASIRATAPIERLDLLMEVYLEADSIEVQRFTENYRMVLGASHRSELEKNVARISRLIEEAIIPSEEVSNEMDGG